MERAKLWRGAIAPSGPLPRRGRSSIRISFVRLATAVAGRSASKFREGHFVVFTPSARCPSECNDPQQQ
jgi:hypothetical protein